MGGEWCPGLDPSFGIRKHQVQILFPHPTFYVFELRPSEGSFWAQKRDRNVASGPLEEPVAFVREQQVAQQVWEVTSGFCLSC